MIEPLNSRITAPNYFLSNLHTGKEQLLVAIDRLLYMYISIVFTRVFHMIFSIHSIVYSVVCSLLKAPTTITTMVYIVSELDGRLSFNIEALAIYTSYPAQR